MTQGPRSNRRTDTLFNRENNDNKSSDSKSETYWAYEYYGIVECSELSRI